MKNGIGIAVVAALALSAQGFTTNVSNVAELAGALQLMNSATYAYADNEIILAKGDYDVSGLNLQYYHRTDKVLKDSGGHFGISYFTLRGETGNPRDVVIYCTDAGSKRMMYSYVGTVRDLTFSNCTTTATDVFHGHNASAIYRNVIVTCCSSSKYGPAYSGTWYDCQFIGNSALNGGALYNGKAFGCTFEDNSATYGGGAYGGTVSNCTFRANSATYGGGICNGVATNCTIVGNAAQYGGGAAGGVSSGTCVLSGCTISKNTSTSKGGGAFANSSGTVFVYGSTISNNVSMSQGGALHTCVAMDCDIVSNVATNDGGGAYGGALTGCLVRCNFARDNGGGVRGASSSNRAVVDSCVVSNNICGNAGGGAHCSAITDSRICMNFVDGSTAGDYSCGGGLYDCTASGSMIDGNAVIFGRAKKNTQGGGAYGSALTNCLICNNYADTLGGGLAAGTAYGCIISNNACKTTSGSNGTRNLTSLVNCDIYEDTVDAQGPVVNCRLLNYTNGNVIAEGANVYTNGLLAAPPQLVKSYGFFTNCLFAGNRVTTLIAHTSARHSVFSNCTFADNWYRNVTSGFIGPTNTLTLINCIFARNRNQSGTADLNFNPSFGYMALTNCLIGSFDSSVTLVYPMSNIITNNNPRFVDDGSRDSYALKRSSPAREKGLVQDWMADALDVRNDENYPRLRDGKVDIGCYECWLDPAGTQMIIR